MGKDFWAIFTNPEREEEFKNVFGRTRVNIETPIPSQAHLPGKGLRKIYKLDMALITKDEREKLKKHIASKFHIPEPEVDVLLEKDGLPILADDCLIEVDNPQVWFC